MGTLIFIIICIVVAFLSYQWFTNDKAWIMVICVVVSTIIVGFAWILVQDTLELVAKYF